MRGSLEGWQDATAMARMNIQKGVGCLGMSYLVFLLRQRF